MIISQHTHNKHRPDSLSLQAKLPELCPAPTIKDQAIRPRSAAPRSKQNHQQPQPGLTHRTHHQTTQSSAMYTTTAHPQQQQHPLKPQQHAHQQDQQQQSPEHPHPQQQQHHQQHQHVHLVPQQQEHVAQQLLPHVLRYNVTKLLCDVLKTDPACISLMHVFQLLERATHIQRPLTNAILITAWGDINDLLYAFEVRERERMMEGIREEGRVGE